MKESFELKVVFPVAPAVVYKAWLSTEEHQNMTGAGAVCVDNIGAMFTAWDGYISGVNLALVTNEKIVQSWRTSEFEIEDEDSKLTLLFVAVPEGCELTLIHENIPEGQTQYEQGWINHYFEPMQTYFNAPLYKA